ncbi:MAG: hypothetical protein QOE13_1291 [Gaiellaceae bacterium]|jgi:hypothetical protein|nr:hypothetical protein [Gaiellaceae bacterium]
MQLRLTGQRAAVVEVLNVHLTPSATGREGWAADYGGGRVAEVLRVVYRLLEAGIRFGPGRRPGHEEE